MKVSIAEQLAVVSISALTLGVGLGACGGSPAKATGGSRADASPGPGNGYGDDDGGAASFTDAGNASLTPSADGGGPLQAHIQVNGNGGTCGSCDVLLVQAQGGKQPYTYAWSDPSWQGPGPFQLCPTAATPVSVTVTDSSASTGEVPMPAQTAMAATSVTCTPVPDGAATPVDGGTLNGCTDWAASGVPDAGTNDAGTLECTQNEVEAGTAWADGGAVASVSTKLSVTLRAGHAYGVSYDQLLPIELGQPVTVDIYGATDANACMPDQKLFTLNLDGSIFSWHQAFCFTPDRDYDVIITNVYIQGVLLYFNPLSVSTLCDTCPM